MCFFGLDLFSFVYPEIKATEARFSALKRYLCSFYFGIDNETCGIQRNTLCTTTTTTRLQIDLYLDRTVKKWSTTCKSSTILLHSTEREEKSFDISSGLPLFWQIYSLNCVRNFPYTFIYRPGVSAENIDHLIICLLYTSDAADE